jgi:hypothetical protein
MKHEYFLWASFVGYFFHVFEEFFFDWKSWVEKISKLSNIRWRDFFVMNGALLALGLASTLVGWRLAWVGLFMPALQLINGVFFHLIPSIIFRRLSPGIFTSFFLFLPLGILCYWGAWVDKELTIKVVILSFTLASFAMIFPFLFFLFQGHRIKK